MEVFKILKVEDDDNFILLGERDGYLEVVKDN